MDYVIRQTDIGRACAGGVAQSERKRRLNSARRPFYVLVAGRSKEPASVSSAALLLFYVFIFISSLAAGNCPSEMKRTAGPQSDPLGGPKKLSATVKHQTSGRLI